MISGIAWVSELIEIAGGTDIFSDLAFRKSAKDRIVNPEDVVRSAPDIMIGSWCGKKFNKDKYGPVRLRCHSGRPESPTP